MEQASTRDLTCWIIFKFRKIILNLDNGRPISNPIHSIFNPVDSKYLTHYDLN